MSHWIYKGKKFTEVPEDAFGFIYRITEKHSGKKYIGRKYFFSTRRIKQKGKTRRKVTVKESDWRTYVGSSKPLIEAIEISGKSNYTFEIIGIGCTKGQVNYMEESILFKTDALIDPMYYNDSVGARRYIGVKIDENFKNALKSISL